MCISRGDGPRGCPRHRTVRSGEGGISGAAERLFGSESLTPRRDFHRVCHAIYSINVSVSVVPVYVLSHPNVLVHVGL